MARPLTIPDVAERWQISEKSVRKFINENRLRHFRLGGRLIRIPVEAVEEYECRNMSLADTGESSASSGTTTAGGDTALRLVRATRG